MAAGLGLANGSSPPLITLYNITILYKNILFKEESGHQKSCIVQKPWKTKITVKENDN